MPTKARGSYPDQQRGLGTYGSTAYPTVIEAYNRASDYKRWKLGMEYWFGGGQVWADRELSVIARLRHGPTASDHRLVTTLFPSPSNAERARHVTCRVRGSVILGSPLTAGAVTVDQIDADPSQHRLVYDTRGVLTAGQLQAWIALIGDQFEDSASGSSYPEGLIPNPLDAVALTLVDVDAVNGRLIFDLSRPYARKSVAGRTYWYAATYDPAHPLLWRLDGSRHLCSSARFQCSCPDYQGRTVANLRDTDASTGELFPLPSASRGAVTPWEAQAAGYYRQWRTLDIRADRRRECKHIHAARWSQNVPFLEPSDYPVGGELSWADQLSYAERNYAYSEIVAFYERQLVGYDRLVPAIAEAIGLNLDPTGELRGPEASFRLDSDPILWTDAAEPQYVWARQNEWWIKRGTNEVRAFSPADGGFSEVIGGKPVLEIVDPASGDAWTPVP
ncbi:MAG: hypothetical protein VKO65_00540 [Cyanobacteriota bacterium]|nr:hypothetical protein [Cyanobacteriota bacterium]